MNKLLLESAKRYHSYGVFNRELDCLAYLYFEDPKEAYPLIVNFRDERTLDAQANIDTRTNMGLLKEAYRLTAREHFEDFCIYTEWDRQKKFYLPRQKSLSIVARELQRLADDELDLLCISMPPGVGKSGLAIMFITWLSGRNPSQGMLIGSHNTAFLRGVYDECIREIDGEEYHWHDVFHSQIVQTNALDMKIDIDTKQRFSTLQFSSVGSGNAGKVRAIQLLYCDDLIPGIEEAMSRERLDKKWQLYTDDLRQRKQGNCKELHIATRWSVHDVIGRLERMHGNNPRARFIAIPALDAEGKSNFDYGGDIGYTTEFYQDMQKTMDEVSFKALYMNEPIERKGVLFSAAELRRYFELPDEEPDAIISVVDSKDRGPDYCVMPVAYCYGDDLYIEEIMCDASNPDIIEQRLVDMLIKHDVQSSRFESNQAGGKLAKNVQDKVTEKGGITKIQTKYTTANKETRILVNSAWVKEHCLFKDESLYTREYRTAMNFLTGYSNGGKNTHDDVPDAFAQLTVFSQRMNVAVVKISKRFF